MADSPRVEAPARRDRAHAAARALLDSPGWKKTLRERIGALSWDRITGERRSRRRVSGLASPEARGSPPGGTD